MYRREFNKSLLSIPFIPYISNSSKQTKIITEKEQFIFIFNYCKFLKTDKNTVAHNFGHYEVLISLCQSFQNRVPLLPKQNRYIRNVILSSAFYQIQYNKIIREYEYELPLNTEDINYINKFYLDNRQKYTSGSLLINPDRNTCIIPFNTESLLYGICVDNYNNNYSLRLFN